MIGQLRMDHLEGKTLRQEDIEFSDGLADQGASKRWASAILARFDCDLLNTAAPSCKRG